MPSEPQGIDLEYVALCLFCLAEDASAWQQISPAYTGASGWEAAPPTMVHHFISLYFVMYYNWNIWQQC